MAENKKRFPGAVGPSYTMRAGRFDCQETMNAYIEIDELGVGKGNEPAVLIKTPGLVPLQTIGAGPIRCMYTQSNLEVSYIVSGDELYEISGENAVPVRITGNLLTSTGPVQMADNGIQIMFVDGQYGYTSVIGSGTFQQITSSNFYPSECITYQDGYFILVQKGTQGFFISDIDDITFPELNEAFAQGSPDILISAYSNNRQLYLLGAKTTEMWWDAGQSGSTPFERQDGKFSQQGCAAANTVAVLNETFLWLGSNAQGGGIVYQLQNNAPAQVSTFPVQTAIQNAGSLSGSIAWSYQQEGHYFYLLNVPGLNYTWVFDLSNSQWTKRSTNINGNQQQLRVNTHCVLNDNHLVGDSTTGDIYRLDLDYYMDGTDPIYFIRQFPHSSDNLNLNFYNLLEIDFQFGVGIPGTVLPQGSVYTQFGGFTVQTTSGSTGIVNFLDSTVPFSMNVSVPQATNYPTNDQPANTLLKTSGLILGNPSIGMGNIVTNYPNQIPVYSGSRTYTGSSNTNYSPSYYFPMRVDDLIWIQTLTINQDNSQFSIEVRIGKETTDSDVYEIVATPVDGFPWVTTVTYTGSIGERNPQ